MRHALRRVVVMTAGCVMAAAPLVAGPVEFGKQSLKRAFAERGVQGAAAQPSLNVQIVPGEPECFQIARRAVTGSDERGLMYGLLQAADDVRRLGHVNETHGCPAVPLRGIRYFLHNHDLEERWYYSKEYWDAYFEMLARDRFNRFNLVFAHQTTYLAPPYPFLIDVPEFPAVRVPHLDPAQRTRNLEMLQYISQDAADHGIDFTFGVWEHDVPAFLRNGMGFAGSGPQVEGITRENVGPYSHAALGKLLRLCPAIRSVQMRTNSESGIPDTMRLAFYRDFVYTAIRDAGRPVYLDLRAWAVAWDMIDAAKQVGVPLRVSTKYWGEHLGRPYQPAETYPGYSYLDFLKKPRDFQFFWELWGLGSHRLLLWGNPDYVRRAVSTFGLGDAIGFEIDPPLAQKGYGNRPGRWGVFADASQDRVFWKWESERYWLFYLLWGRLSYSPSTPEAVWLEELQRRFGAAAGDVLDAYESASGVINEIVAAHLADPNMYIWPELNPGGLLDGYRDTLPSDWRYIASIPEAVQHRVQHTASAKQTPRQTAALLDGLASRVDEALARVDAKIPSSHAEWRSSRVDFQVLSLLARYHAQKQVAVEEVTYFDAVADRSALESARNHLQQALRLWEQLVTITDGVYPAQMAFGPDDIGHWKDKLAYVQHDLKLLDARAAVYDRFGRFDFGFDFGAPVKTPPAATAPGAYRQTAAVLTNSVAPRFNPADAETLYDEHLGYGWLSKDARKSVGIPLTPYAVVQSVASDPDNLPGDVLYRDFIAGEGPQVFRIKAPPGTYRIHMLHPDGTDAVSTATSTGEVLDVVFPAGHWSVSGLVVQGPASRQALSAQTGSAQAVPTTWSRPRFVHHPVRVAVVGRPIALRIEISPMVHVSRVRLHYRGLNQKVPYKAIEKPAGSSQSFLIPGEDVSAAWGLMYYFEILDRGEGGWFEPDPQKATPYYVVDVQQPGASHSRTSTSSSRKSRSSLY